jgi:processive 1,2-diacylglycerol beta-glucosyltransferase
MSEKPRKKKILLATSFSSGGGHITPTTAVKDALEPRYSQRIDSEIIDFYQKVGAHKFDKDTSKFWKFSLKNPFFLNIGCEFEDKVLPEFSREICKKGLCKELITKAKSWFKENHPNVFFSTHFFCTMAAIEARKKLRMNFPIITFNVEPYYSHSLWMLPETDSMIVSSEEAKKELLKRGFPEHKIIRMNFPIRPSFLKINKKPEKIMNELGINKKLPKILISAGAEGLGKLRRYTLALLKAGLPINLIAICGRNEKIKKEFDSLKSKYLGKTNFIPLGFVTNMNEILSVTDLFIMKASGGSFMEAIYTNTIPLNMETAHPSETANVKFFKAKKIGINTTTRKKLIGAVRYFVKNPGAIEEYKSRIKAMNLKTGAYDIADFLVKVAERKK